ncbi:MAG: hypothetical protein IJV86_01415 [Clostridia bacterium]|nr:hypothetical protein [Clostridia bacterium]
MKKNYRTILGYALVMTVCVLLIVFVAALSENKISEYEDKYNAGLTISQKQIQALEKQIADLSQQNEDLKKQIQNVQRVDSDLVTHQQAMSDMKDIFYLYEEGKKEAARDAFEKINTMGFDDNALSYYELLSALLNK